MSVWPRNGMLLLAAVNVFDTWIFEKRYRNSRTAVKMRTLHIVANQNKPWQQNDACEYDILILILPCPYGPERGNYCQPQLMFLMRKPLRSAVKIHALLSNCTHIIPHQSKPWQQNDVCEYDILILPCPYGPERACYCWLQLTFLMRKAFEKRCQNSRTAVKIHTHNPPPK